MVLVRISANLVICYVTDVLWEVVTVKWSRISICSKLWIRVGVTVRVRVRVRVKFLKGIWLWVIRRGFWFGVGVNGRVRVSFKVRFSNGIGLGVICS